MLPLVWIANIEVMIPAICCELMKRKDRPDKMRLDMSGHEYRCAIRYASAFQIGKHFYGNKKNRDKTNVLS